MHAAAPMCSIQDNMKPPGWQVSVLKFLAKLGPTWAITPVRRARILLQ